MKDYLNSLIDKARWQQPIDSLDEALCAGGDIFFQAKNAKWYRVQLYATVVITCEERDMNGPIQTKALRETKRALLYITLSKNIQNTIGSRRGFPGKRGYFKVVNMVDPKTYEDALTKQQGGK